MKLIGITGTKGSGKDTSVESLDMNKYTCIAMADPLKQMTRMIFDLSNEQTNNHILKETIDSRYGKSPRELLQWFGTDCIREQIKNDFWLDAFVNTYNKMEREDPSQIVIVTDIRFKNEADIVNSLGGTVVRVERDIGSKSSAYLAVDLHVSETEMNNIVPDFVIVNNGNVAELQQKMLDYVERD